jgi:glyoxylase-like metal-dependent hydrolase (beta-lactamase superfamily II)
METRALGPGIHLLPGGVNCGLVETANGLLCIDTGLDRGAANRIARAAEELGRPLVAILNTHAHADHHGGNAQLLRRFSLPVYAPAVEAAVIREPRYEAVYLFGGAEPVRGLINKFLQAEASPVDHLLVADTRLAVDGRELQIVALPGHSLGQVGVRVDDVLFAADGFFGQPALEKHGVPYLVDAPRWMETLERLLDYAVGWMVPGHGDPLDEPGPTLRLNLQILKRAEAWLDERLQRAPAGSEELLAEFAQALGMRISDPPSYVLNRAAMLGFLGGLERQGRIEVVIEAGRWIWRRV